MVIGEKYEVLEVLGKGGCGTVYKVLEKSLDRILAMKETKLVSGTEREVYEKETRILKTCFHPALPVIFDSFWQGERHYMVMEYVEGITLKEYVDRHGKVEWKQAVKLCMDLGEILSWLHTRNQPIVYGDLKPDNIMITREGTVRLLDFGTAGLEEEQEEYANGCYASFGYAAPEQKKGKKAEITSDIYSFGAVIHYMLTGEDPCKPPYIRRKLRECDGALPKGLETAVNRCLKEHPAKRYPSVKALLDELDNQKYREPLTKMLFWGRRILEEILTGASLYFAALAILRGTQGVDFAESKAWFKCILFLTLLLLWRFLTACPGFFKKSYRLEKNIWKTEKQGIGLFIMLAMFGTGAALGVNAEREEKIPVTVYDETGCKVCVQERAVYPLTGAFRLEIPGECFEQEKVSEVTVTLTTSDSNAVFVRQFQVCPKKKEQYAKSSIENQR